MCLVVPLLPTWCQPPFSSVRWSMLNLLVLGSHRFHPLGGTVFHPLVSPREKKVVMVGGCLLLVGRRFSPTHSFVAISFGFGSGFGGGRCFFFLFPLFFGCHLFLSPPLLLVASIIMISAFQSSSPLFGFCPFPASAGIRVPPLFVNFGPVGGRHIGLKGGIAPLGETKQWTPFPNKFPFVHFFCHPALSPHTLHFFLSLVVLFFFGGFFPWCVPVPLKQ